ncbi:MAG: hypothetical protein Q8N39_04115 [Pelolinea sp.]|nr:hypothetical protein [Pelolinea sp.]
MDALILFLNQLTKAEKSLMDSLDTPFKIQAFLDLVIYPGGEENRSPIEVLRQRKAHCLDGALFAATALRLLGFEPLIIDMLPDPGKDDDHILALFKVGSHWGAIAKSNFSGLRFREPIHRTLRELVMTYFEDFFNIKGEKTLRYYSRPVHLTRFDRLNWMTDPRGLDAVEKHLYQVKPIPLITSEQAAYLSPVAKRSFDAGTLGLNYDGVYKL